MMLGYYGLGLVLKAVLRESVELWGVLLCIGLPAALWNVAYLILVEETETTVAYTLFVPPLPLCQVLFWSVLLVLKCRRVSWRRALLYAGLSHVVSVGDLLLWEMAVPLEPGLVTAVAELVLYELAVGLLWRRTRKRYLTTKDVTVSVLVAMGLNAFVNMYAESGPYWIAGSILLQFAVFVGLGHFFQVERIFPKGTVLAL